MLSLSLFVGMLSSCTESALYDAYIPVPETGWHKDSAVTFDVTISDTTQHYGVVVQFRHNAEYPYQNLYLFREIRSVDGVLYQDTINYQLAKPSGEWLGSGFGALKTIEAPFNRNSVRFNDRGTYQFRFAHGMRDERLHGMEDMGLRVYPVNPSEQ